MEKSELLVIDKGSPDDGVGEIKRIAIVKDSIAAVTEVHPGTSKGSFGPLFVYLKGASRPLEVSGIFTDVVQEVFGVAPY